MPRIRNISPEEFRRLFEAPEIQTPSLSVSEAINLSEAIASRERKAKESEAKIAEIERALDRAEKEQQLGQTLATPAMAPERDIETAVGPVPTEQIGLVSPEAPAAGPVATQADLDQLQAEQAREQEIAGLQAQLDPTGTLQAQQAAQAKLAAEERDFARDKELLGMKFANQMELLKTKEAKKAGEKKLKTSALIQRLAAQGQNLSSMVSEFDRFEESLQKEGFVGVPGVLKGKIAVPLDKLTGGAAQILAKDTFMGNFLKVNPEISTQDELADSLARRIYKTISGDVGNIAFSEGAFAKAFVPRAGETPSRRNAKVDRLKRFIKAMDQGAKDLRQRFDAGLITDDQVGDALGNVLNTAFIEQAEEQGMSREEIVEGAEAVGLTPAEQAELQALRQEFGGP
jgi:hypothetical protein